MKPWVLHPGLYGRILNGGVKVEVIDHKLNIYSQLASIRTNLITGKTRVKRIAEPSKRQVNFINKFFYLIGTNRYKVEIKNDNLVLFDLVKRTSSIITSIGLSITIPTSSVMAIISKCGVGYKICSMLASHKQEIEILASARNQAAAETPTQSEPVWENQNQPATQTFTEDQVTF